MKLITAAVSALLLGSSLLVPRAGEACTEPGGGADEPRVEDPGTGPGAGTESGDNPAGEAQPTPGEGDGTGGGNGDGTGGGGGDGAGGTAEPEVITTPQFLIAWEPGSDRDADPNQSAYYGHPHELSTHLVIRDVATQKVVLDELIPQYDYAAVTRGKAAAPNTSRLVELPAGSYEAKVQSVFYRHDKVRYGMEGSWKSVSPGSPTPDLGPAVKGIAFVVRPLSSELSGGSVSGGCSAVGASSNPMLALLAISALGLVRRRR